MPAGVMGEATDLHVSLQLINSELPNSQFEMTKPFGWNVKLLQEETNKIK